MNNRKKINQGCKFGYCKRTPSNTSDKHFATTIVLYDINDCYCTLQQVILALSGGELWNVEVDTTVKKLLKVASVHLDQDVACLSLRTNKSISVSCETTRIGMLQVIGF